MKKNLLFIASLMISMCSLSQFTENNEPQINDGTTLYVIDSMAPDYESVTGTGVTWDYSEAKGYDGEARNITVQAAADAPSGANFPSSTKAINIQDFLVSFISSDAIERNVQGFVFSEPNFGSVEVHYNSDVLTHEYDFDFGDEVENNNVEGTTESQVGTNDFTGDFKSSVDGEGTLLLANGVSFNDVLRYKIEENILIEDVDLGFVVSDVVVNRVQYEYYSHSDQTLPIFVHSYIYMADPGGFQVFIDESVVMSIEDPEETLNNQVLTKEEVNIFPNPVESVLTVNLANSESANITITDALGKVVLNQRLEGQNNTVNTADFTNGIYFVKVNQNNQVYTQKIIKK